MASGDFTYIVDGHRLSAPPLRPALYCVATPIGNLGDVTLRALQTLAAADVVACEDTRTTGILLRRYGIEAIRLSYTEHNAQKRGSELLDRVEAGEAVALVSDAGTPLISDPGHRLVRDAVERGLSVVPLPGANAPLAALVGSGLESTDFRFLGFIPPKQGARRAALENLKDETSTLIFFEAPTRIIAALEAMAEIFGPDRRVVVARELTKMHETFHRGTLSGLRDEFSAMDRVRGEIVICVEGRKKAAMEPGDVEALLRDALETMKTRDAARHVAELTGTSRQHLYARALELKRDG